VSAPRSLWKSIQKYARVNPPVDSDGFKHSYLPLLSRNLNLKRIFLFGNVALSLASLFRRKFQAIQSRKVQYRSLVSMNSVEETCSLPQYLLAGQEKFWFASQFSNYRQHYLFSNTLFILYEAVFDYVRDFVDFLELPRSAISLFPCSKLRASSNRREVESSPGFAQMYGEYSRYLESLPDFQVVSPQQAMPMRSVILKHSHYRRLLYLQLRWEAFQGMKQRFTMV